MIFITITIVLCGLYLHYENTKLQVSNYKIVNNKIPVDINNYKIASEEHIWNLVYLNNNWLHLDLTWDDPVNENGKDILDYNYYLITTKKLKEIDNSKSHRFNKDFYLELKES